MDRGTPAWGASLWGPLRWSPLPLMTWGLSLEVMHNVSPSKAYFFVPTEPHKRFSAQRGTPNIYEEPHLTINFLPPFVYVNLMKINNFVLVSVNLVSIIATQFSEIQKILLSFFHTIVICSE